MSALLDVKDLVVEYRGRGLFGKPFRALHGVSVQIGPGETLGLVGESGSGKTTLGRAILGLAPVTSGVVEFAGRPIQDLGHRERRRLASEVQVVFQDPYTSLNPAMSIGAILAEPLQVLKVGRQEALRRIADLLEKVGLPADSMERYPSEFSGGQRQRVAIARALALDPSLIVCDEPVSALDLSTQARVLDLFIEIQERTGVAYLFVSHDLQVIRYVSHRVAVMYAGSIVEQGDAQQVTEGPRHGYTRKLMMASPLADPRKQRARREQRQLLLEAVPEREGRQEP